MVFSSLNVMQKRLIIMQDWGFRLVMWSNNKNLIVRPVPYIDSLNSLRHTSVSCRAVVMQSSLFRKLPDNSVCKTFHLFHWYFSTTSIQYPFNLQCMYSANIASQNSIKSPTSNKRTLVEDRGVGDCRSTILLAEMHPFCPLSQGYGIASSTT